MMYSNKIKLKRFSDRYLEYYKRCKTNRINCLEGAYRAGKSVINIYSFANYLEHCDDRIHLVSGYSASTARNNVCDCNGLGLKYIFRGRCKEGKFEGNECLTIKTRKGEKIVLFVGGGMSDSYKKIQGLSFGSWLSVELANLYISDDEKCFIDMALSRTIQSSCPRIWWDLNPVYPSHRVYQKYLDNYEEMSKQGKFVGGYNYMKCSLFDNTALSRSQIDAFLSGYPDENSMEYQRYILGNRACANGIIFTDFSKNTSRYVVSDRDKFLKNKVKQFISIGVDFGGNGSNTAFVATIFYNNYQGVLIIDDDEIDMSGGESDSKEFHDRFKDFVMRVQSLGVGVIRYAYGDSADPVMINEMRSVIKELKLANSIRVLNCVKDKIINRIKAKKKMMYSDNWHVCSNCKYVINSTKMQVWDNRDNHNDERLDNGSVDIDIADAEEYSWSAFMNKLIRR